MHNKQIFFLIKIKQIKDTVILYKCAQTIRHVSTLQSCEQTSLWIENWNNKYYFGPLFFPSDGDCLFGVFLNLKMYFVFLDECSWNKSFDNNILPRIWLFLFLYRTPDLEMSFHKAGTPHAYDILNSIRLCSAVEFLVQFFTMRSQGQMVWTSKHIIFELCWSLGGLF